MRKRNIATSHFGVDSSMLSSLQNIPAKTVFLSAFTVYLHSQSVTFPYFCPASFAASKLDNTNFVLSLSRRLLAIASLYL